MPIDTQLVVALGTAIATVILSLAPLVRSIREPITPQFRNALTDPPPLATVIPSASAPLV
jgi:hypothetical protein